ncbi:MAG: hypothetical protein KBA26_08035 [Candidatus Delongbacteria bacterium]|nr:hypothetical protein [Candidatus Delongbacteria bacterium]
MKPWIDHRGRLFQLINVYDLLAILILLVLLISGRQAWTRYQNYRSEKSVLNNQRLLTEEKSRLAYRKEYNDFFIFDSVPDSVVPHLTPGLIVKNRFGNPLFEIREIVSAFPVLIPGERDLQSQWMMVRPDSTQRSILMRIRYHAEEYRTDSIYFNHQRFYPGRLLAFPFPMQELLGRQVNYDPAWGEIQSIYSLINIPPAVAHHTIKPGTPIVDQFNRLIAEFQDILSIQPYRYTDKINRKTAEVTSSNLTMTARLLIRLYQINHQYYLNFSPFTNRLDGYIRMDSTRWLSCSFNLADPLPPSPDDETLRCRVTIHQLRSDEADQIKPGQSIYNPSGQSIGTITHITTPPISDFYHSHIYKTRNCIIQSLDPNWKRISATAEMVITYANGLFYAENTALYPNINNHITLSLILKGNHHPKKAEISFPVQMETHSESLAIHLYTRESFAMPALLMDPGSGTEIIGRILGKTGTHYLAEVRLDIKGNRIAYYNDQSIHYTQELPFIIYTRDKLITTTGNMMPHHPTTIEMIVDDAQLKLIETITEPSSSDPYEIRIVSIPSDEETKRIILTAKLYRIMSNWYFQYPDIPITPGQSASIRIGRNTINGTIQSILPRD